MAATDCQEDSPQLLRVPQQPVGIFDHNSYGLKPIRHPLVDKVLREIAFASPVKLTTDKEQPRSGLIECHYSQRLVKLDDFDKTFVLIQPKDKGGVALSLDTNTMLQRRMQRRMTK